MSLSSGLGAPEAFESLARLQPRPEEKIFGSVRELEYIRDGLVERNELDEVVFGYQETHIDESLNVCTQTHLVQVEQGEGNIRTITHRIFDETCSAELEPPESIFIGNFIIGQPAGNFMLGGEEKNSLEKWASILEKTKDFYFEHVGVPQEAVDYYGGIDLVPEEIVEQFETGYLPPDPEVVKEAMTLFAVINSLIPSEGKSINNTGQFDVQFEYEGQTISLSDASPDDLNDHRGINLEYITGPADNQRIRRYTLGYKRHPKTDKITPFLSVGEYELPKYDDMEDASGYRYKEPEKLAGPIQPLGAEGAKKLKDILWGVVRSPLEMDEISVNFPDGSSKTIGQLAYGFDDAEDEISLLEQLEASGDGASYIERRDLITAIELKMGASISELYGILGEQADSTNKNSHNKSYETTIDNKKLSIRAFDPIHLEVEIIESDPIDPNKAYMLLVRTIGSSVFEYIPGLDESETIIGSPNRITPELYEIYLKHFPEAISSLWLSGMKVARSETLDAVKQVIEAEE